MKKLFNILLLSGLIILLFIDHSEVFAGNIYSILIPDTALTLTYQDSYNRIIAIKLRNIINNKDGIELFNYYSPDMTDADKDPIYCVKEKGYSWIGKKIMLMNDGLNIILNRYGDSLVFNTKAVPGDSWTFYKDSSGYSYIAKLDKIIDTTFLGIQDSVKIIELLYSDKNGNYKDFEFNGTKLLLSKNHGLISMINFLIFPEFNYDKKIQNRNLSGLSNPKTGKQAITFYDTFNYEVGDIFHVEYFSTYPQKNYMQSIERILTKEIKDGKLIYTRDVLARYFLDIYPRVYTYNHIISTEEYDLNKYIHALPGESMLRYGMFFEKDTTLLTMIQHPAGINEFNIDDLMYLTDDYPYYWKKNDTCFQYATVDGNYEAFFYPGLGKYWVDSYLANLSYSQIIYFKKGSHEWGIPFDSTEFTDVTDLIEKNGIAINPNPASDFIEINLDSPSIKIGQGGVFEIGVWDVFGQKATTPSLRDTPPYKGGEKVRIDVSSLAPGVYFVRIGSQVIKFIKI